MASDDTRRRITRPREFAAQISRRSLFLLFLAIFFTFAPIGALVQIARTDDTGMVNALMWFFVCGIAAVGWGASFIVSLRLLPVAIGAQILLPIIFAAMGLMRSPAGEYSTPGVLKAALCILSIITGYILFIRFIRGEALTKLRLQTEMSLAGQIHKSLVPPIDEHSASAEVYGRSEASSEMGGDLIDVVPGPSWVDLYLADISGHGVRAGVLMAMVKSSIRTRLLNQRAEAVPLDRVVGGLNEVVAQVAEADMFATFACLRIHASRRVEFALAGHLPILHIAAATGEVRELKNECLPLGVDATERFASREVEAASGDLFVLLTDGLMEVADEEGHQLGLSGLKSLIQARAHDSLPHIYNEVLGAVRHHGGQSDDQTLLLARIA